MVQKFSKNFFEKNMNRNLFWKYTFEQFSKKFLCKPIYDGMVHNLYLDVYIRDYSTPPQLVPLSYTKKWECGGRGGGVG